MALIMIVDDNEQNRYLLEAILKGGGFETVSAKNGRQALEMAAKQAPAMVITDLLMPEMDGFQLCRLWKSDPALRSVPLIVYTATYTEPQDEKLALNLGADRFVIKPQEPDVILSIVKDVFAQAAQGGTAGIPALSGEPCDLTQQHSETLARKLDKKVRQLEGEIQERIRAEEALRESENRFRLAARAATDLIYEWDAVSGRVSWFGDIDSALGFEPGQFPRTVQAWTKQMHGDDQKRLFAPLDFPAGSPGPVHDAYRIADAHGNWRHWVDKAVPARIQDGKAVLWIGACEDATERKNLENQLHQAQKMEAVGHLAGGIAHDFNNLIQVILGFSDLILWSPGLAPDLKEKFEQIHAAAERASAMTRQLMAFARKQVIRPQYVGLNSILADLSKMLIRLLGETIELEIIPTMDLGVILADPGQVDQILFNMCINARDAMPHGGRIVMETQNISLDEAFCASRPEATPGQYVMMRIFDTGCGMNPATLEKIFEPFFTTKEEGKGTGLGLSTVYGIMKQHNGFIEVQSEPGRGSAFSLYFPRVEKKGPGLDKSPARHSLGGDETILVAEDDDLLRDLAQHILEREGYRVLKAANGEEALSLFRVCGDKIDLAFLDVVMPRMGGRAVMEQIAARNPKTRFLFTSGYSQDQVNAHFSLDPGLPLLPKPYHGDALLQKIREVLDRK